MRHLLLGNLAQIKLLFTGLTFIVLRLSRIQPGVVIEVPRFFAMAEHEVQSEDFNSTSSDINISIGKRLVSRRKMLRLSQEDLAKACGVSSQQIWKYENGLSSIKPSRLVRFAEFLDTPVSWFFDEPERRPGVPEDIIHLLRDPRAVDLMRFFYDIDNETGQSQLLDLAELLANSTMKEQGEEEASAISICN